MSLRIRTGQPAPAQNIQPPREPQARANSLFVQDRIFSRDNAHASAGKIYSSICKWVSEKISYVADRIKSIWNRVFNKFTQGAGETGGSDSVSDRNTGKSQGSLRDLLQQDPRAFLTISGCLQRATRVVPHVETLSNGDRYCLWTDEEGDDTILSVQLESSHQAGTAENRLEIHIATSGLITSTLQDGREMEEGTAIDGDWNKHLTELIDQIIWTRGMQVQGNGHVHFHPLAIKRHADKILGHLCQNGRFEMPERVQFLDDEFQPSDAIDAGGLRRQFFNDLCKYLFLGKPSTVLNIASGIPTLNETIRGDRLQAHQRALRNLGYLIQFCDEHTGDPQPNNNWVTGRTLPEMYFQLLTQVMGQNLDQPFTEEFIIRAGRITASASQDWLWQTVLGESALELTPAFLNDIVRLDPPIDFGADEGVCRLTLRDYLLDVLIVDENIVPREDDRLPTNEQLTAGLRAYLIDINRPIVEAAKITVQAIPVATRNRWTDGAMDVFEISGRVQGAAYDREYIANLVEVDSRSEVVRQKAAWLKELIREQPETPDGNDWIKALLKAVTGSDSVSAATAIKVRVAYPEEAQLCVAHTCFQTLEVPATHVSVGIPNGVRNPGDKEKFRRCLELLILEQQGPDFNIA